MAEKKKKEEKKKKVEKEADSPKKTTASSKKGKKEAVSSGTPPAARDKEEHPLERYGPVRKAFILENIRIIDYRDIARLIGLKEKDLKAVIEDMGIKLPIDHARRWKDIDVGSFRSLSHCSRCHVQLNHSSFFVGEKNCRKCYEKNIAHWVDKNVPILVKFSRE